MKSLLTERILIGKPLLKRILMVGSFQNVFCNKESLLKERILIGSPF